jgi:multidrug resistance efflux pump
MVRTADPTETDDVAEVKTMTPSTPRPGPSGSLSERVQSLRLPPPVRSTRSSLAWFVCAFFVLTTISAGLAALAYQSVATGLRKVLDETAAKLSELETARTPVRSANGQPVITPGTIVLESKGYIIPEQQILVSPQVSGRVIELNFEAGQRVKEGFVLAVLDSTEYRADLARSKALLELARVQLSEALVGNRPDEIRQAEAELAETKTNMDQAERNLRRKRELREKGIVTAQELDDAQSQFDALVNRHDKLNAAFRLMEEGPRIERKKVAAYQVEQAEAELTRSQWRLDNCTIEAPISGTILKKNAELGNLVNPVAFNGSFSLCDIADLSRLEVELSIQERDISKVFQGQKCRVRADAFPERNYDGVVSRLMPIADRAKGAVPVRVRLRVPKEEEGAYLKPEMGAIVTFYQEKSDLPLHSEPATLETPAEAEGPVSAVDAE